MVSTVECILEHGVLIPKGTENLKDWFLAQIMEAPSNVNNFRISFEAVVDEDKKPEYQTPEIYEHTIKQLEAHVQFLHNALIDLKEQMERQNLSSNPMDYIFNHQKVLANIDHALIDEKDMFINE